MKALVGNNMVVWDMYSHRSWSHIAHVWQWNYCHMLLSFISQLSTYSWCTCSATWIETAASVPVSWFVDGCGREASGNERIIRVQHGRQCNCNPRRLFSWRDEWGWLHGNDIDDFSWRGKVAEYKRVLCVIGVGGKRCIMISNVKSLKITSLMLWPKDDQYCAAPYL